jgi:L-lactate dehydrogenase complex protein LldE
MPKTVYLFTPCLVDQWYPPVADATVQILTALGHEVIPLKHTTCCGQPAYNTGAWEEARTVACHVVNSACWAMPHDAPIIVPSGSCAAMIRHGYNDLFPQNDTQQGDALHRNAAALCGRVFELTEYLLAAGLINDIVGSSKETIFYHHACHASRELGINAAPVQLLQRLSGITICGAEEEPVCCGFGGLFCAKFDGIAQGIAKTKLEQIRATGATKVVSTDSGCLMHLERLAHEAPYSHIVFEHVAVTVASALTTIGVPT